MTRPTLAATLTLCLTIACTSGKTEGTSTQPDPLTTRAGFCEAWAEAACNDEVVDACVSGSAVRCQARAERDLCLQLAGVAPYALDAAEACLDEVRAVFSDAVLSQEEYPIVLDTGLGDFAGPCAEAVLREGAEGTPGPGEECDKRTNPCGGENMICVQEGQEPNTVSVCRTRVLRTGGETCGAPRDVCEAGTYCDSSVEPSRCFARLDVNDPCNPQVQCLEDLFCDGNGRCQSKGGPGDSCEDAEQCLSGICLMGTDRQICADEERLNAFSPTCRDYLTEAQ